MFNIFNHNIVLVQLCKALFKLYFEKCCKLMTVKFFLFLSWVCGRWLQEQNCSSKVHPPDGALPYEQSHLQCPSDIDSQQKLNYSPPHQPQKLRFIRNTLHPDECGWADIYSSDELDVHTIIWQSGIWCKTFVDSNLDLFKVKLLPVTSSFPRTSYVKCVY